MNYDCMNRFRSKLIVIKWIKAKRERKKKCYLKRFPPEKVRRYAQPDATEYASHTLTHTHTLTHSHTHTLRRLKSQRAVTPSLRVRLCNDRCIVYRLLQLDADWLEDLFFSFFFSGGLLKIIWTTCVSFDRLLVITDGSDVTSLC